MLKSFRHTETACYFGYITQAVVNNLVPLLFLVFRKEFGVSLAEVTALVTVNFAVQLFIDLLFANLADKIGYRTCLAGAHFFAAAGLAGLAFFPKIIPNPFVGLLIPAVLYAVGGGLIEVLVSPLVEACPSKNKAARMSLLHSFYCWGSAAVVLLSTCFFLLFGQEHWQILALVWAVFPLLNGIYFLFVPIVRLDEAGRSMPVKQLVKSGRFWLLFALMIFAGAAELSMSQWASAFAESGLGVSKTAGDLAGPCLFALLMGLSRLLYSRYGKKLRLFLILSGVLCIGCYLLAWLAPVPALGLVGCALCGFSVGIMWPGIYSLAAETLPAGGTAMFALLALGGDLGCSTGPTLVGLCAGAFGDDIGTGLAFALVFPVMFVLLLLVSGGKKEEKKTLSQ